MPVDHLFILISHCNNIIIKIISFTLVVGFVILFFVIFKFVISVYFFYNLKYVPKIIVVLNVKKKK